MDKAHAVTEAMARHGARKLDFSRRGSGVNAVWEFPTDDGPFILKTYARRRGPLQSVLSNLAHITTGRTAYMASARCKTERRNLKLWADNGFAVPRLFDNPMRDALPVPSLCMEFVEGPLLSALLSDPEVPQARKDRICRDLFAMWGQRHAHAVKTENPALLQEHPGVEHVIKSADRLVTFDLEVSYTRTDCVADLACRELVGGMRSLLKRVPASQHAHYIELMLDHYGEPSLLAKIDACLLHPPGRLRRTLYTFDRRWLRRKRSLTKYDVAEQIVTALAARK